MEVNDNFNLNCVAYFAIRHYSQTLQPCGLEFLTSVHPDEVESLHPIAKTLGDNVIISKNTHARKNILLYTQVFLCPNLAILEKTDKIIKIIKGIIMSDDKIILTGIKPTGMPHIGNYVGALKPLIKTSQTNKTFVFIADLHALNSIHDANEIKQHTYEIAALLISLGLNTQNAILFRQSDIDAIYKLNTFLMNVTPKGLMNRAHSYKAMLEKNAASGDDPDNGVNMGLYTYPILMSADILLYNADIVPVGADQKQHVEFARDIAEYFNRTYGNMFRLPEPQIGQSTGLIPGLDGRKMSKSYDNTIPLFAPENELKKKIMRIITDSKLPDEPKNPDESTIYLLYKHFATDAEIKNMRELFENGKIGYGDAKKMLFEKINETLAGPRQKYEYLMSHTNELDEILADGAARATSVADKTIEKIKHVMLGK